MLQWFTALAINILYNIGGIWPVLPTNVQVTPLKTPFGLLTLLFQSRPHVVTITHSYFLHCYTLHCWLATICADSSTLSVLTIDSWLSTTSVGAGLLTLAAGPSTVDSPAFDFSSVASLFRLPSHCLKKGLAGPKWEHLPLLLIYAVYDSVTYETSVLLVHRIAAASF
jgi:hypothetical protein